MRPTTLVTIDPELAARVERALAADTYTRRLLHAPAFHTRRVPPAVLWASEPADVTPLVTLVVPCFEQQSTVAAVLEHAVTRMTLPFDLIVIDDGSSDGTPDAVAGAFAALDLSRAGRVLLIRNPVPIFETACDNQGFVLARTEHVIELQADIWVEEEGFDAKLLAPLRDPRVSAVSGRFVHPYDMLVGRRGWLRYPHRRLLERRGRAVGLLGERIFAPGTTRFEGVYYAGETAARGPWALRRSDLAADGYLDEAHFFLGNDDHDFHRRMYVSHAMLPVYCPLRVFSTAAAGPTRRPRTGVNAEVYVELSATRRGSPEFQEFLRRYRPFFRTRPFEPHDPGG